MGTKVWIDGVVGTKLKGWALIEGASSRRVELRVYCDDTLLGEECANLFRRDLKSKGMSDGYSGYLFELPDWVLDGAVHVFRLDVLDGAGAARVDGRSIAHVRTPKYSFLAQANKPWVKSSASEKQA